MMLDRHRPAWATGQVLRQVPCPDWVARFQDASLDFSEAWQDGAADESSVSQDASPQQAPRVLDGADLDECLAAAVAAAGTGTAQSCAEIRVSSQIVARRTADDVGGHEFLNSFIMGDLTLVAEQTAKGNSRWSARRHVRGDLSTPN